MISHFENYAEVFQILHVHILPYRQLLVPLISIWHKNHLQTLESFVIPHSQHQICADYNNVPLLLLDNALQMWIVGKVWSVLPHNNDAKFKRLFCRMICMEVKYT